MPRHPEFAPARRTRLAGAAVLAGALLFAGAPARSETAVGREAPDFTLEAVGGGRLTLAAQRGRSATVLVFFRGTW
jgi:hypothetical protein